MQCGKRTGVAMLLYYLQLVKLIHKRNHIACFLYWPCFSLLILISASTWRFADGIAHGNVCDDNNPLGCGSSLCLRYFSKAITQFLQPRLSYHSISENIAFSIYSLFKIFHKIKFSSLHASDKKFFTTNFSRTTVISIVHIIM